MTRLRNCIRCRAEITGCFGSVLARDMIAYNDGRIPATAIREHCGMCVVRLIAYEYGGCGSKEETHVYLLSLGEVDTIANQRSAIEAAAWIS